MENTEESWKKYKPELSDYSIKKRIGDISRLNKNGNTIDDKIKYIKTVDSINSRQGLTVSLVEYQRMTKGGEIEKLEELSREYKKEQMDYYKNLDVELPITIEEIENRINELREIYAKSKCWTDRQNLLMILIYARCPPRNELRILKKKNYDKDIDNYIDEDYNIVENQYKSSSLKSGQQIIPIKDEEIKKLIDEIKTTYVIIPKYKSIRDKPISRTAYISVVKSVCCGVTSGVLRQLYASENADYDKKYMQKQEEAASILGHSMYVHINYIKKKKSGETSKYDKKQMEKKVNDIRKQLFFKKK